MESVELPTSDPARIAVTSVSTETGGVHGADELKEEMQMTGRRRRSSVKEIVEKIEKGVAAENSSRDRLMSDRKKKFEKIEVEEQQSVVKKNEARKKREEKKLGSMVDDEKEEDMKTNRRQLTIKEMMQSQLVGRKKMKEK